MRATRVLDQHGISDRRVAARLRELRVAVGRIIPGVRRERPEPEGKIFDSPMNVNQDPWRMIVMLLGITVVASCASTAGNEVSARAAERSDRRPSMTTSLLQRVSVMQFDDYEPGLVIEAVNHLQPLGKAGALAEIESYLASRNRDSESTGLFWVLRVLFDVPAEIGFPPVLIGQPEPPAPMDPKALPRFPIVMVRDRPLLVVRGYVLAGLPERVQAHVDYFRQHGSLRKAPLAPAPVAMDILEEEFQEQWRTAYGEPPAEDELAWIREQLARLGVSLTR